MVLKKLLIILAISMTASLSSANLQVDGQLSMLTPVENANTSQNKKEVLVYFWATWCPDCKSKLTQEFKNSELYKKYDVYLVSTDKNIEKVTNFKNKNEIPQYVYVDQNKELQKKLNVFSVPTIAKFVRTGQNLQLVETQTGGDISRFLK